MQHEETVDHIVSGWEGWEGWEVLAKTEYI